MKAPISAHRLNLTVAAILVVVWGTTWAAIRIGLEGIPPFTGAAMRFGIGAAVLLVAAWMLKLPLGRSRRERWLWLINGLLSFTASYGIVYWAEQFVPSGLTSIIFATFPLFTVILAHFFLPAERMTPGAFVGTLIGFAGVSMVFSEDFSALSADPRIVPAIAILLLSPLAVAVTQVAIKRWGGGIHPISLTAVPMVIATLVLGVLAWLFERDRPLVFTPATVGSVLYLSVIGSAFVFWLYYWLLDRVQARRVSLIAYVTPLVAVALGTVLFDEPLTPRIVLGGLGVVAGVALATRR